MDITEAPKEISALALAFWTWAVEFLPRFGAALLIVVVGYFVAGWVARAAASAVKTTGKVDSTLHPVIHSVVRYSILVLVGVAALGQLGVQTTSLLAVLGAAGLAIGLALQGTLSNIAAGMMILWLRPFRAGDFIETADVTGTIEEIGLFHAQMRTWDGIYKFVPNSQLWNVVLTNYTRNPTRMMQIEVGIDYAADLAHGREVMTKTARNHPGVLDDPPPLVVPLAFADSSVNLQLRAWASTETYWDVRWELTQNVKRDLEAAGIGIPFPQRVVHMLGADKPPPPKPAGRKRKTKEASAADAPKGPTYQEDQND